MATMYGFALYTLPERFVLHYFAIVQEMGIGIFKGLIGAVMADLRIWLFRKPEGHIFGWH